MNSVDKVYTKIKVTQFLSIVSIVTTGCILAVRKACSPNWSEFATLTSKTFIVMLFPSSKIEARQCAGYFSPFHTSHSRSYVTFPRLRNRSDDIYVTLPRTTGVCAADGSAPPTLQNLTSRTIGLANLRRSVSDLIVTLDGDVGSVRSLERHGVRHLGRFWQTDRSNLGCEFRPCHLVSLRKRSD